MSPAAALHDPIFRAYLGLVLGLLVLAGIVLTILQFGFRIELGNVWKTYRSWLVMAPLAALVVFAGRVPFIIGVTAVASFGFREFARASRLKSDNGMTAVVYAGLFALGSATLFSPRIFDLFSILTAALVLLLPILRNRARGELQRMSLGLIAFLYLGWMFGHLAFLSNAPNAYGFVCFVLFATEVCDVAAFTFGKSFGRHPLRSAISPRKTWEGALGAFGVAILLPWLLRFSFPFFGAGQLVLASFIVGIGAPLGDLSISLIKRDLGAKDTGAFIPGHGGILDRIDSLIFVAPLFTWLAGHYHPGR